MSEIALWRRPKTLWKLAVVAVVILGTLAALIWIPAQLRDAGAYVVASLLDVAPLVIPGILLAAWVAASGAGATIAARFEGHLLRSILAASFIGALTPVCGVTVLPLMAGLLAAGVPLAPVMAFWLSSPITDPAMLAATAATLGFDFAVGKTLAAFGMGLLGGVATAALSGGSWTHPALRDNRIVGALGRHGGCDNGGAIAPAIWKTRAQRRRFLREAWATGRLLLICLTPAFAAEFVLNALLEPTALAAYVGRDVWWAVPLAVVVGAPAYLDGYAALPLARGLVEHGMSPGAALAFLVSGGVVSIWGAMAIFPVLRLKPFLLYLALALAGSLATGWIFDLVV